MDKELNFTGFITKYKAGLFIKKYGFYIIYVLWFLIEILINCSTPGQRVPYPVYLSIQRLPKYALFLYILLFQQYSLRQLLVILPVTVLFYISARLSQFHELFYSWLFIIGMKDSDFDKIAYWSLWILGICIPLYALLCWTGVFPDAGVFRGSQFRTALGFIHPNSFGVRVFIFSSCWYYVRRGRLSAPDYIFVLMISVFVWLVPNSRTASLGMILLTVLLILYSNSAFAVSRWRSVLDWILVSSAVLANLGTVLLTVFYSEQNTVMRFLDKVVSLRFTYANQLFREFGVSLFGRQIYVDASERIYAGLGNSAVPFDNSYMRILLHWGVVVYALVSVLIILGLIYERRRKNPTLFLILCMVLIYSFSEKILYQATYSVFILAFSDCLYRKIPEAESPADQTVP